MKSFNYYLGPFVAESTPFKHWRAPHGSVGYLDMRPPERQAEAGCGLFATRDTLNSDYRLFGKGYISELFPRTRSVFADMLGLPDVDGHSLLDWLVSARTVRADPSGYSAVKPLRPTTQGHLDIWLSGHSLVWRKSFDLNAIEAKPVIALMQNDYRRVRRDTLDGLTTDPQLHRKMLDCWGHQFKVDPGIFIPRGLPLETRVPHSTTVSDNFNRGAANLSGSTASGGGTWSEPEGAGWATNGTAASSDGNNTVDNTARLDSDLSSDDMYAQFVVTSHVAGGGSVAPAVRFAAAANTFYYYRLYTSGGAGLWKRVAGSTTRLTTWTNSIAVPDTPKIQANGSTLEGWLAGVSQGTTTDTDITGNLRAGMWFFDLLGTVDDFLAEDLVVAAGGIFFRGGLDGGIT